MTNQVVKEIEKSIKEYFIEHPELLPEDAGEVTSMDQLEVHLADFFDCIAGVSGGSWQALYYASKGGNGAAGDYLSRPEIVAEYGELYPGSAKGLDVFFEKFAERIYPPGWLARLPRPSFGFSGIRLDFPGINSPRYPPDGLEEALQYFYGQTKMSDLATNCIVNVYDTEFRNPVLFTFNKAGEEPLTSATSVRSRSARVVGESPPPLERTRDYEPDLDIHFGEDFYIKDVARASSAIPAFHIAKEVYPVGNDTFRYVCIDGAVVGPNPSLHSMNFLLRMQGDYPDIFKIAVVSLGTGYTVGQWTRSIGQGVLGWLLSGDLIQINSVGGSEALQSNIDFLLYSALKFDIGQYLRIQVFADQDTDEGRAIDSFLDPSGLQVLKKIGKNSARQHKEEIDRFVRKFIFTPEE